MFVCFFLSLCTGHLFNCINKNSYQRPKSSSPFHNLPDFLHHRSQKPRHMPVPGPLARLPRPTAHSNLWHVSLVTPANEVCTLQESHLILIYKTRCCALSTLFSVQGLHSFFATFSSFQSKIRVSGRACGLRDAPQDAPLRREQGRVPTPAQSSGQWKEPSVLSI